MLFIFTLFTVPGAPRNVKITHLENNKIKVTCTHEKESINGPVTIFIAQLYISGTEKKIRQKGEKCEFVFDDLSYSTAYRVEVCIIPIFGVIRFNFFFPPVS